MSVEMWIGFAVGALVGLFVATVFYAVKWNEEHNRAEIAERDLEEERREHNLLKMDHEPRAWLDSEDVAVKIAGKEKMYDKYPDLVQPGTEVIQIDDLEDIPDLVPNDGRST